MIEPSGPIGTIAKLAMVAPAASALRFEVKPGAVPVGRTDRNVGPCVAVAVTCTATAVAFDGTPYRPRTGTATELPAAGFEPL